MKKLAVYLGVLGNLAWAAAQVAAPASTSLVKGVYSNDGREILADSFSRTLYVFDPDQGAARPVCNGSCAEKWPPLLVSQAEADELRAPLAVIARENNLLQLTYNGRPVYTFFLDRKIADTLGEGLGNVWHTISIERSPWDF